MRYNEYRHNLIAKLRHYIERLSDERQLNTITSREQFEQFVRCRGPSEFLFYRGIAAQKIEENRKFLKATNFKIEGNACLDIGPGHGESLDLWREMGARECAFVENNPWFFTHNRLKPGLRGWKINHLRKLSKLPVHRFDFIWVRGSVSAQMLYFRLFGRNGFHKWVSQVEQLAVANGLIVICPWWCVKRGRRIVEHPDTHWFAELLEERGYKQLPFIDGHNRQPEYPITWVLRKHGQTR